MLAPGLEEALSVGRGVGDTGYPQAGRDPEGKFQISFLDTESLPAGHLEGIWWMARETFSLNENLT